MYRMYRSVGFEYNITLQYDTGIIRVKVIFNLTGQIHKFSIKPKTGDIN